MSDPAMSGLRPEQGPPLAIPMGFFFVGPLAMAVAGGVVLATAGRGLDSVWAGPNAAVVHLATVGLLMSGMLGALYQMLPVVAGAAVAAPRLGHAVNALCAAGAACLVWAQATAERWAFGAATVLLGTGLLLFWVPAGLAIARTEARGATVQGIRLAFLGLLAVAAVGLWLSGSRAISGYGPSWVAWRWAHAHLGLIAWVGCLIAAVSWQVLPMFYLAAPVPGWVRWTVLGGVATTLVLLLAVFFASLDERFVPWAALPGALAVWGVEPVAVAVALWRRKRRRRDPGLWFWWLAVACGPLSLVAAAAAAWTEVPAAPLVYGLLALWGWAAAVMHGMLTRIVPFLVWFHRCAGRVGIAPVPSTRELFPDRTVARGFLLHLAALVLGLGAIVTERGPLWILFGAALAATGLHLAAAMAGALWRAPRG